jgi:hypothetical protein
LQIEKEFSLPWEFYRVATHELGGIHLIAEMETKYSTRQLYDMLETLDTYDTIKRIAHEEALAKAKQEQKNKG